MEFPGVDSELEEEYMAISDMEPEGNVDIPGLDTEGQVPLPQVVDINDPEMSKYPILIALEVPADPDGTTQLSTQAK